MLGLKSRLWNWEHDVKSLRPIQNGRHVSDDISKFILSKFIENFSILLQISLKLVFKGPVNNKASSVGSDNGLAPSRRQAIIRANVALVYWSDPTNQFDSRRKWSRRSREYHPGCHYWDYYTGALSLSRVTATDLKTGHP